MCDTIKCLFVHSVTENRTTLTIVAVYFCKNFPHLFGDDSMTMQAFMWRGKHCQDCSFDEGLSCSMDSFCGFFALDG